MPRICEGCDTPLPEDAPNKRRFCTHRCNMAHNHRVRNEGYCPPVPPARRCEGCDAIIPEGTARHRRFCTTKCGTRAYHSYRKAMGRAGAKR